MPTKRTKKPNPPSEPSEIFDASRLYKYDEIAEALSLSERTLRYWVDRKLIRSVKLPGGRRFLGSELNRFIADRES